MSDDSNDKLMMCHGPWPMTSSPVPRCGVLVTKRRTLHKVSAHLCLATIRICKPLQNDRTWGMEGIFILLLDNEMP